MNMGNSILGTRVLLIVAYANLAPSGDHQWAIWDWKISSEIIRRKKRPSIIKTANKNSNSRGKLITWLQANRIILLLSTRVNRCSVKNIFYNVSLEVRFVSLFSKHINYNRSCKNAVPYWLTFYILKCQTPQHQSSIVASHTISSINRIDT